MAKRNLITAHIDVEAKVYFKELKNEVIAYYFELSGVSINSSCSKILIQRSGLCSAREFDLLQDCPEDIIEFETQDLKGYSLWTKDVKEDIKNGIDKIQDNYNIFISEFAFIFEDSEKFDKDNIVVGRIDQNYNEFYEYKEKIPYPRRIYFDFFNGVITDEYYNLEELINILSKRKDIVLTCKEPIDIPNRWDVKYISFYWYPSQKDWEKYVKSPYFHHYYRYEWILKNILGLRKKDKDERK